MNSYNTFKNYEEACHFLVEAASYGCVLGLNTIRELLKRLGNPQDNQKFIHIAGTNGKGSVSTYISSVLCEAGYTVGRYNTPPNKSFREIIRLNEMLIEKDSIIKHLSAVKIAINDMVKEGLPHPTRFEIEVATALLYFKEQHCDFSILEVGMGGQLDATNIISKPLISIITSVSMDHMARLGNTLELIARQKAGIIKENSTVVSIQQNPIVNNVINEVAKSKNNKVIFANPKNIFIKRAGVNSQFFDYIDSSQRNFKNIEITLPGIFQFENAIISIEAIEQIRKLGFHVSETSLKSGLKKAKWDGRFSIISNNPLFITDGGHNEDAARRISESLNLYFPNKKKIFILGISHDKECEKIVNQIIDLADCIVVINAPQIKRLLSAKKLTEIVSKYYKPVIVSDSIENAVENALNYAKQDDIIIAFGSSSIQNSIEKFCSLINSHNSFNQNDDKIRDYHFSDDEIHKYY